MEAKVYRLDELPVDSPMEKIERRRIVGQQMMISVVSLEPGFAVPTHRHDNEQFAFVVSGRVRFGLQRTALRRGAGGLSRDRHVRAAQRGDRYRPRLSGAGARPACQRISKTRSFFG
jgi:hypothetical protein